METDAAIALRLQHMSGRLDEIKSCLDKQNGRVFEHSERLGAMEGTITTIQSSAIKISDVLGAVERGVRRSWISIIIGVGVGTGSTLILDRLPTILKAAGLQPYFNMLVMVVERLYQIWFG